MRAMILAAFAALALAGCASYGGYPGGGYGDPGGGYGQPYGNEVVGTVSGLDRDRIILVTEGGGGYGYGGQQVAVYYDNRTTLYYRG